MNPEQVSGRAATRAWRALDPARRAEAWAAAKAGAAPESVELAAVMAGHGGRRYRQLRWFAYLAPFQLLILACVLGTVAAATDVQLDFVVVEPVVMVFAGGSLFWLFWMRNRYRRLATAGTLGLEAAQAGALAPAAQVGVVSGESEFTVPVTALRAPVAVAPAGPGGVTELPSKRAPLVITLVASASLVLCISGNMIAQLATGDWQHPALVLPKAVVALLGFAGLALLLTLSWRALRTGVLARFTPEGWELPGSGLRGPWSDVTGLDVRAPNVTGGTLSRPGPSMLRLVVLRVPDQEVYLRQTGVVTAWFLRRAARKYGSPVTIAAGANTNVTTEQLIAILRGYTDAPVRWT